MRDLSECIRTLDLEWSELFPDIGRRNASPGNVAETPRRRALSEWSYRRSLELLGASRAALCSEIQAVCAALSEGDFAKATSSFLASRELQAVRPEFNEIAARFERTFTIHGLHRSFRFWSDDEKRSYIEFGNRVVESLGRLSNFVCYGFGVVLGLERAGDFVPHDDDIDIVIAFERTFVPTIADGLRALERHVRQCGYDVTGSYPSHRHVQVKGQRAVDVFVGMIENGFVSVFPSRRRLLPKSVVFPSVSASFLGMSLAVPRDAREYLRLTYGEGWMSPDQSFGHPWQWSEYNDIAGS